MLKKILALAAGITLSLNASAGYVQYNISNATGEVSGYFIQHDDDKTIAYYNLKFAGWDIAGFSYEFEFEPSRPLSKFGEVTTNFAGSGPTSFVVHDQTDIYFHTAWLNFYPTHYFSTNDAWIPYDESPNGHRLDDEHHEMVGAFYANWAVGSVNSDMASYLDANGGYAPGIQRIIPTPIRYWTDMPEPTSIALFAIGAIGAAGAARRRKSKQD